MRRYLLGVALCGAILAPASAGAISLEMRCASGYHVDRGGNCQPDARETNRFCPRGFIYQPAPDGYRCLPPPPRRHP